MPERCSNCGAELFEGQQFCRACGAAVRPSGEDAPTQLLAQGPPTSEPAAATARLGARGTDPSIGPRPAGYQPPASFQQTAPLAGQPAAKGRAGWLFALVAVALVSALGTLGLVFAFRSNRPTTVIVRKDGHGERGFVPPLPPELPARVREAVAAAGAPQPLDESDADVSDEETVVTQSFPLAGISSFSLKNFSGPVRVEGWDGDEAEVQVVKRGGSRELRGRLPILSARAGDRLALMSGGGPGTPVSVACEIRLPRGLRQLEISSETSDVRVEGLEGTVVVDLRVGDVEFHDVTGVVRSNVIKGATKVVYRSAERRGPQEFKVNLGDVEVHFPEEPDASVKAETIDGEIKVDEGLGLQVRKAPAGYHVAGRLGEGREPLLIRVVNGDIRLKK
jgi:Putative adhesin